MTVPDYLVHYHYKDKPPFLNLSDLPEAGRGEVISALNRRHEKGEIRRHFPDWYMPQRLEAEKNLREHFLAKGGKPQRQSPHYFTLGFSPLFERMYEGSAERVIRKVQDFGEDALCFCLNDSLWTMASSHDPAQQFRNRWFEGTVYSYAETVSILTALGLDVENQTSLSENKISFVEGLVWQDDRIF